MKIVKIFLIIPFSLFGMQPNSGFNSQDEERAQFQPNNGGPSQYAVYTPVVYPVGMNPVGMNPYNPFGNPVFYQGPPPNQEQNLAVKIEEEVVEEEGGRDLSKTCIKSVKKIYDTISNNNYMQTLDLNKNKLEIFIRCIDRVVKSEDRSKTIKKFFNLNPRSFDFTSMLNKKQKQKTHPDLIKYVKENINSDELLSGFLSQSALNECVVEKNSEKPCNTYVDIMSDTKIKKFSKDLVEKILYSTKYFDLDKRILIAMCEDSKRIHLGSMMLRPEEMEGSSDTLKIPQDAVKKFNRDLNACHTKKAYRDTYSIPKDKKESAEKVVKDFLKDLGFSEEEIGYINMDKIVDCKKKKVSQSNEEERFSSDNNSNNDLKMKIEEE